MKNLCIIFFGIALYLMRKKGFIVIIFVILQKILPISSVSID